MPCLAKLYSFMTRITVGASLSGTGIASGQRVKESIKTTAYSLPNFDRGNLIKSTDNLSQGRVGGVLDIIPRVSGCRGLVKLHEWQDSHLLNISWPMLGQVYNTRSRSYIRRPLKWLPREELWQCLNKESTMELGTHSRASSYLDVEPLGSFI
jgi:hypothetical protein